MIVGIGTDLCRVSRVKHSLDRFGDTFARTYCNPREIEYAKRQLNPAMAFSQCLATKEAFAKAAGTGFNSDMWWDDVETTIADNGPSRLLISADAASLLKSKFELLVHRTVVIGKFISSKKYPPAGLLKTANEITVKDTIENFVPK